MRQKRRKKSVARISFVDEDLEMEEGMDDAGAPQEFEQLQDLDDILKITEPQGEMEVLLKNKEEKAQD